MHELLNKIKIERKESNFKGLKHAIFIVFRKVGTEVAEELATSFDFVDYKSTPVLLVNIEKNQDKKIKDFLYEQINFFCEGDKNKEEELKLKYIQNEEELLEYLSLAKIPIKFDFKYEAIFLIEKEALKYIEDKNHNNDLVLHYESLGCCNENNSFYTLLEEIDKLLNI